MSVDKQLKPSAAVLECINGNHEPIYKWLVLMQSDTLSIFGDPKLIYGSLMLVYRGPKLIYGSLEPIYGALEYAYKIPRLLEKSVLS